MSNKQEKPMRLLLQITIGLACAALLAAPALATEPDAIIKVWEEHWTLNPDGSSVYHFKQHVQLNNDRTYDDFADPRITYDVADQKLEIVNARVLRPDGTYRELADYSHVEASPNSSAGWPVAANLHQHVLVMSGIEPGCVVELEYKITTNAGAKPEFAADVRLDHTYPVTRRVVGLHLPNRVTAAVTFMNGVDLKSDHNKYHGRENVLHGGPVVMQITGEKVWSFDNLPGVPHEAHTPAWHTFCPRFAFSTAGGDQAWLVDTLDRIENAADSSDLIREAAQKWAKDATTAPSTLRAIQEGLAASYNFVEFNPAWRSATVRPASQTFASNHGVPEESAALFLALARAAGVRPRLAVLADQNVWVHGVGQREMAASYVLVLGEDDDAEIWDPHRGRLTRDARWAGHSALLIQDGKVVHVDLPKWTSADESRCAVHGGITLAENGTYEGNLHVRLTGLFVSNEALRDEGAQKRRLSSVLQRVLPAVEVRDFDVLGLSGDLFEAVIKVRSGADLEKLGSGYWLTLAQDGPHATEIQLPLNHSRRELPVAVAGPFGETVSLRITWPQSWHAAIRPHAVQHAGGDWGRLEQTLTPLDENSLKLERYFWLNSKQLQPEHLLALRGPLNTLRTEACRAFLFQPR